MKKTLLLSSAVLVIFLFLVFCGGKEKGESTPQASISKQETKTPVFSPEQEESFKGTAWKDIPIYPGSEFTIKSKQTDHPQYNLAEIQHYKTQDLPAKVDSFYKKTMLKMGWKSHGSYEVKGSFNSSWGKNNKDIMAFVKAKEARLGGSMNIELIRMEGKK